MLNACKDWSEKLSAYLDDEVNAQERSLVEHHLQTCAECRATAELYRCDEQDMAAALGERGASASFATAVMNRVAEETIAPADRYQEIRMPAPEDKPRRGFSFVELLVVVAIVSVGATILFPVFAKSREKSRQTTCTSQIRQIATAMQMYLQDEKAFPPADTWALAIENYVGSQKLFTDPLASNMQESSGGITPNNYRYNTSLAGKTEKDIVAPTETPVVWDSEPRHNGMIIGFADGHAKFFPGMKSIDEYATRAMAEWEAFTNQPADAADAREPHAARPDPKRPESEQVYAYLITPTITPPAKNYGLADKLQIAYKVEVALESADVQAALERGELLFRQYDGFVLASNYQRGKPATATVSGRVPSENLGKMLVEIDRLGTLVTRTVNGEDLTALHLENLEKLGDLTGIQGRVGAIQDRAKPGDALRAEDRMTESSREASGTRIEEYKLKSKVRLAEITIRLIGTTVAPAAVKQASPLLASLRNAVRGLGGFGLWLLSVLIPIAIFTPVWLPLLLLARWLWKRYGRRPRQDAPSTD